MTLDSANSLNTLAADMAVKVSGKLGIGCLRTIAPLVLSEIRRAFENNYPMVSIKQFEGDHAELIGALQRAEIDVALTYDLELPSEIQFEPLHALPPYVMLPPTHRLAGQTGIVPEELTEEPLILLDLPSSSQYFLSAFSDSGLKPKIAERVKDLALVRSMVASGFGYSLANLRFRTGLAPNGKPLKIIPLIGGLRPLYFGYAVNRSDRKPRTLAAFEDHCRSVVEAKGLPGLTVD